MNNIAFCEDNEFQREIMQGFLDDFAKTRSVNCKAFASGEELLKYVKLNGSFDIYLLDVVMPGINGMEIANTLRQMYDNGHIIFVTSSLEYAVMSYDVNAYYYLTKPVDPVKLNRILDSACSELTAKEETIEIRAINGDMRIRIKDIMFVELYNRAPLFHLKDGRVCEGVKLRGTFHDIVAPLFNDKSFVACGVGKVVNLKCVDALDSESLLLFNGTQIYFPRSAYADLKVAWKNFGK